ncbi:hypothetical protein [Halorussus marinus]|uniref:hypothetical protein n=1 Tax=Halorussus marinus TaxID=2505976 RepID=UPI00106ED4BC|nr:hypothetical protein [Halorussus marinus]
MMKETDENQMVLADIDGPVTEENDSESIVCIIVHAPTRKELAQAVRSCLQHGVQLASSDFAPSVSRAKFQRKIASGEFELDDEVKTSLGNKLVLGIDSDRAHVEAGVAEIERNPVTHVVVNRIGALGSSHAEIRDRAEKIVESAELHLNDTGIVIDSGNSKSVLRVLKSLDKAGPELQREASIRDVRDWLDGQDTPDRGRAPLGFRYFDGEMVTTEEYDHIRSVLSMVLNEGPDKLSKRKAAKRLDTSARTIGRALDNADRYGLSPLTNSTE